MACKYFATRRAGRKHEHRPSTTNMITTTLTQPSPTAPPDAGVSPTPIQLPTTQQDIDFPESLPNMSSPADNSSWWMLTTLGADIDNFFTSPLSFYSPEASDWDNTGHSLFSSTEGTGNTSNKGDFDLNDPSNLIPDDAIMVMDGISEPINSSKQIPLTESHTDPENSIREQKDLNFSSLGADSPCGCLLRALGLLKKLFRSTTTACKCSKKQGDNHMDCPKLPTIQAVIVENEQTIETVTNVLQCPCLQDRYLLAIVSLIVFKILAWYAAAARETPLEMPEKSQSIEDKLQTGSRRPSSCHSEQVLHSPAPILGHALVGEDQGRAAAKLVLSELHRVQRLVNDLSKRLKAVDGQDSVRDRDADATHPFSVAMLHQLEADLRKCLRTLSLEIVDMLRRG